MTNSMTNKETIFGDVYSYNVELNTKYNHYRVNEFKNGEFFADYGEYKTKKEAITRMTNFSNE